MSNDKPIMAIIRGVRFGLHDRRGEGVELAFAVYISETQSAPLSLDTAEDIAQIIEAYGVSDVSQLEGRPCWVEIIGGQVYWVKPCLL